MALRLYNTLTRQEEDFTPLDPTGRTVTFYSCGPTVYDYAHIGNFRSFLNADVLRRTLELLGHDVRHVMNITDVGHMTEDDVADGGGEDKMDVARKRLLEDKKSGKLPADAEVDPNDPYGIANFYADAFIEDATCLGMKVVREAADNPRLLPRPTQYIPEMINLVSTLIERGHAYVAADGVVYFDVQSYEPYGRLSGNTPDAIRSGEGGRVNEATQAIKRHPADFMLWKPDPHHVMKWDSPWGAGYPGWHLECSVMAGELLGADTGGVIDLHSGGEDNIFPHHECEIAQSCCANKTDHFARYWVHTRFLIVEGEKMSKSQGNFFTVRDLLGKGATPAAIRLELIRSHYRSQSNFTMQGLREQQRQIDRLVRVRDWLQTHADAPLAGPGALRTALATFTAELASDINVSGAIGALNKAVGSYDVSAPPPAATGDATTTYADELDALLAMDSVLGVFELDHEVGTGTDDEGLAATVEAKIAERNAARAGKDWAAADRVRDELIELGVAIKDGPDGTTWTRIVQ